MEPAPRIAAIEKRMEVITNELKRGIEDIHTGYVFKFFDQKPFFEKGKGQGVPADETEAAFQRRQRDEQ